MLDLVSEIQSYLPVSDVSSNSSHSSEASTEMPASESFMQMLNKSRRSSSSTVEGEISALEESIISKSGIEITKHNELKKNEELKGEQA